MEKLKEVLEDYLHNIKNLEKKKLILLGVAIAIICSSFIFLDMFEGENRYENGSFGGHGQGFGNGGFDDDDQDFGSGSFGGDNQDSDNGGFGGGGGPSGGKEGATRNIAASGLQLGLIGAGMLGGCVFFRNKKTKTEDVFVLGDKNCEDKNE